LPWSERQIRQKSQTSATSGIWALDRLERRVVLLQQVEDALERIAVGDYGTCLDCWEPTSEKRFVALPSADLCLNCQEAADNRDELWEEATMG
jgi:RNA polymerase-binding transcription factor DksA